MLAIKIFVSDDFTKFNTEDIIKGDPSPLNGLWKGASELFFTGALIFAAVINNKIRIF